MAVDRCFRLTTACSEKRGSGGKFCFFPCRNRITTYNISRVERVRKLADEGKVKRKKIAASQVWTLVESD
jgi:hypothetical protein